MNCTHCIFAHAGCLAPESLNNYANRYFRAFSTCLKLDCGWLVRCRHIVKYPVQKVAQLFNKFTP